MCLCTELVQAQAIEDKAGFKGVTVLAACSPHFPCRKLVRAYKHIPKKPALQILLSTFGTSKRCVRQFLKTTIDKGSALFVHPFNETCVRAGRKCFDEDLRFPDDKRRAKSLLVGFQHLAAKYNSMLFVSGGLEDLYTRSQAKEVRRWVTNNFPGAGYVRNSAYRMDPTVYLVEYHGSLRPFGKMRVYSNDGDELPTAKLRDRARQFSDQFFAFFMWRGKWQGIQSRFTRALDREFLFGTGDIILMREAYAKVD